MPKVLRKIRLAVGAGLGLVVAPASAQLENLDEEWRWGRFGVDAGVHGPVLGMVTSETGRVWVATDSALIWYDGHRWRSVPHRHVTGHGPVQLSAGADTVLMVANGRMFMGDTSGFVDVSVVQAGDTLRILNAVYADPGRITLIGAFPNDSLRLYEFHRGSLVELDPPSPLQQSTFPTVGFLWRGSGRRLWLNAEDGLYRRDGEHWRRVLEARGAPFGITQLRENERGQGVLFVSVPLPLRGVWEWDADGSVTRGMGDVNRLIDLDIGPNGQVLGVFDVGDVITRVNGTWHVRAPVPALRNNVFVRAATAGSYWVGTPDDVAFFRGRSSRWHIVRGAGRSSRNRVYAMTMVGDTLWFGTGEGIGVLPPGRDVRWIDRINGTRVGRVTSLVTDASGGVWVSRGGDTTSVDRWDGRRWRSFGRGEGMTQMASVLRADRRGRIWASPRPYSSGQDRHLLVYEGGRFQPFTTAPGSPAVDVFLTDAPDGSLWFTTARGLARLREGAWTEWTPGVNGFLGGDVFEMLVTGEGTGWFADPVNGLGRVGPADSVTYLTEEDGLPRMDVRTVSIDPDGALWLATGGGLIRFANGAFHQFDERVGLPNSRLWPVIARKNEVFAGTLGAGVAVLNKANVMFPAPHIDIHRVSTSIDPAGHEPRKGIAFRWHPLVHGAIIPSETIETRFRLDGGDWSGWTTRRTVEFAELPRGAHLFEVQAKCPLEVCPGAPAASDFTIPSPVWLQTRVVAPFAVVSGSFLLLALFAVIRKRRSDRAVRKSEARYRAVVESQTEFVVRYLPDGKLTFANDAYCRRMGKERDVLLGTSMMAMLPDNNRDHFANKMLALAEGQDSVTEEYQVTMPDGTMRWHQWTDRGIFDARGQLIEVQSVGRDVSERRRAEWELTRGRERLEALTRQLLSVQEVERRRLARDLHDELGQVLTAVKLGIQSIGMSRSDGDRIERIERGVDMVDQAVEAVRNISFDLRPPVLDDLGLVSTLRWYVNQFGERTGLNARFAAGPIQGRCAIEVETACFRIVQEALTNVARHAHASEVRVELNEAGGCLTARIADDGVGFDTTVAAAFSRLGLAGMEERATVAGGTVHITSRPDGGTTVWARFDGAWARSSDGVPDASQAVFQ